VEGRADRQDAQERAQVEDRRRAQVEGRADRQDAQERAQVNDLVPPALGPILIPQILRKMSHEESKALSLLQAFDVGQSSVAASKAQRRLNDFELEAERKAIEAMTKCGVWRICRDKALERVEAGRCELLADLVRIRKPKNPGAMFWRLVIEAF
jgi:hypothetical protein